MKITKKIIAIGVVVLMVAATLLIYNFVFTPKQEETELVQQETAKLSKREGELRSHFLSLQRYRSGIEEEHQKQDIIIAHFPQTICEENEIMFIDNIEKTYDAFFTSLGYGHFTPFAEFSNDVINSHLVAQNITLSGNYAGTYQGLKDIITYVNNQQERMIINNISASYDTTTGLLSGSMDFTMYVVNGSDRIYTEPFIEEDIRTGRHNIFGTME